MTTAPSSPATRSSTAVTTEATVSYNTTPPSTSPNTTLFPPTNTTTPQSSTLTRTTALSTPNTTSSTAVTIEATVNYTTTPPSTTPNNTLLPPTNTTTPQSSTLTMTTALSTPATTSSTAVTPEATVNYTTTPPSTTPNTTLLPPTNTTTPQSSTLTMTTALSTPATTSSTAVTPEATVNYTTTPPSTTPNTTLLPPTNTSTPQSSTLTMTTALSTPATTSSTAVTPEATVNYTTTPPSTTPNTTLLPPTNTTTPQSSTLTRTTALSTPATTSSTAVTPEATVNYTTTPPSTTPNTTLLPPTNTSTPQSSTLTMTTALSTPATTSSTAVTPEATVNYTTTPPSTTPNTTLLPPTNTSTPQSSTLTMTTALSSPATTSITAVTTEATVNYTTTPPSTTPNTTLLPPTNTSTPQSSTLTMTTALSTPATTSSTAVTPEATVNYTTTPPSTTPNTTLLPPTNTSTPQSSTLTMTTALSSPATTSITAVTTEATVNYTTTPPSTTPNTTLLPPTNTTTPQSSTLTMTTALSSPATTSSIAVTTEATVSYTTTPPSTSPYTTLLPPTNTTTPQSSTLTMTTALSTPATTSSNVVTPEATVNYTTTPPSTTPYTTLLPPTITTTPQVPLKCFNGGMVQDGVCICPDEWSGDTCSIANFCNKTQLEDFEFPQTVVGWFAYSSQMCPPRTTNAGISRASARCSYNNGNPKFDSIEKIECELTLENIQANVTVSLGAVEAQQLASSTQILTSRPEQLTASNITSAAQIVNTILSNSINITEGIAEAAVTTISQLLAADPQQFSEQSNATVGLTGTLERFSVSQSHNASLVVQPRLVVQSTQVRSDQTAGIQFSALSGTSNNFTTNRIQLEKNISEIGNPQIPSDVQIFIRLPPERSQNVSVGFVLYENDLLFRSKAFQPSLGTRRMVISGSLGNVKAEQVNLRFTPMNVSNKVLHDFACVSWDYSLNDWSTQGCSKVNLSTGGLQCRCNHTTNFAVLMSFRADPKYAEALSLISIVGCSLSIVGLILTIIFQIITRNSRKSAPTILLVSICVCMTIFYFLFLFGMNNPNASLDRDIRASVENTIPSSDLHQEPDKGPCTALTALMQYFLLATFTWNTLYAGHIFVLIRKTLSGPPRGFLAVSIAIGWGFPAVVVAITLGVTYRVDDPLGYRREEFCWLAALNQDEEFDFGKPFFWGFLLPVAIMLLLNAAVLIYFGISTCKKDPLLSSTSSTSLKKLFMSSFSLGALLGLTWVLGYLVISTTDPTLSNIFSILFCVCNTTQGLQIFILFTVRTANFRKMFLSITHSVSVPEIGLHRQMYVLQDLKKGSHELSRSADTVQSDGTFSQTISYV
ncbi:adhesion G-protein coupled receptor G7-like isoform X2 [Clupea harengus]|nr:adhesion G-protein coupled receptor G7-like isoform X2 [Clupea harengus]